MRRVWRLGQTQPVKVLFLVYRHTLEESALALIGEKMKAALLLYGDNAASAITADADAGEGSLLNELASRILNGEQLTADGVTGLLAPALAAHEVGREPFGWRHPQEQEPAQHTFADSEASPTLQPIVLPTDDPTTHRLIWAEHAAPIVPEPEPVIATPTTPRNPIALHAQLSIWQTLLETTETEKKPSPKVYKQHAAGQLSFLDLVAA